jgi:TctA family transporter
VVEVKFIRFLPALLVLALAWLPGISPAKFSAIAASSTSITASNSASPAQGIFDSFRGWFSDEGANQELLPPDEAFKIAVRSSNADTLVATLTAADGKGKYACIVSLATSSLITADQMRQQLSIHDELVHATVEINLLHT